MRDWTYPEVLDRDPMFRRCGPDEIRIRHLGNPRQCLLNPSAASLVFTTATTDPKPLTDPIAKRPRLDTLFLCSLLDLQPVFVGPRCESHGDVWPLKTRVAREKIGQEEGMKVAYVWC